MNDIKTYVMTIGAAVIAAVATYFYMDSDKNTVKKELPLKPAIIHYIPVEEYNIYLIDGCEYLGIRKGFAENTVQGLAHKGNCTNTIHHTKP